MKRFPVAWFGPVETLDNDWDAFGVKMMTAEEIYALHKADQTSVLVIMDGSIIKPYDVNGLPNQVMKELRKAKTK